MSAGVLERPIGFDNSRKHDLILRACPQSNWPCSCFCSCRVRITKQHRQVGGRTRRNSSSDDEIALAALDGEASPRPALALSSAQSQLALAATAVLWGTNPVCLRYLDTAPHPPSAALVTSVQSAAAAGWLSLLGWALALAQAGQARRLEAKEGRLVPERQSGAGFG